LARTGKDFVGLIFVGIIGLKLASAH